VSPVESIQVIVMTAEMKGEAKNTKALDRSVVGKMEASLEEVKKKVSELSREIHTEKVEQAIKEKPLLSVAVAGLAGLTLGILIGLAIAKKE